MGVADFKEKKLLQSYGFGLTLKAPVTTIVVCFVICLWF